MLYKNEIRSEMFEVGYTPKTKKSERNTACGSFGLF